MWAVNPSSSAGFKQTFRPSGAGDDIPEAQMLLQLHGPLQGNSETPSPPNQKWFSSAASQPTAAPRIRLPSLKGRLTLTPTRLFREVCL